MDKQFTILFQGDSVTDCGRERRDDINPSNIGLGHGYPGLISSRLLCDRPDINWAFINRGVSGNRIVDLYARWKIDALNLKPDLISILIGVNDTWHSLGASDNGVEVDRAERIYRELLAWTKNALPNVKLILMEPFAFSGIALPQKGVDEVAERSCFTKKLADEFGAVFLPCQSFLNDALKLAEPKHWLLDGVHPAPAGHQLISDHWIKAAKSVLP